MDLCAYWLLGYCRYFAINSSTKMYQIDAFTVDTIASDSFVHSRLGMTITALVVSQVVFGVITLYFKVLTRNHHAVSIITRPHKVWGMGCSFLG